MSSEKLEPTMVDTIGIVIDDALSTMPPEQVIADLDSRLSQATDPKEIKSIIDECLNAREEGIDTTAVLASNREHCTQVITSLPSTLEAFLSMVLQQGVKIADNVATYREAIDLDLLKTSRNNFISVFSAPMWEKSYPLFFTRPVDPASFLERVLDDVVDDNMAHRVLYAEISADRLLLEVAKLLLDQVHPREKFLIWLVADLQSKGVKIEGSTFHETFHDYLDDERFRDIFMWEFRSIPTFTDPDLQRLINRTVEYYKRKILVASVDIRSAATKIARSLKKKLSDHTQRALVIHACDALIDAGIGAQELGDIIHIKLLADRNAPGRYTTRVQALALECGDREGLLDILTETVKINQPRADIADAVRFIAPQYQQSRVEMMRDLRIYKSPCLHHWVSAIFSRTDKYDQVLEDLHNAGLTHDEAVESMKQALPEAYEKYQKSLCPNILTKALAFIKTRGKAEEPVEINTGFKID